MAPTVITLSAKLKLGKLNIVIKSLTQPTLTLSTTLESPPAKIKESPTLGINLFSLVKIQKTKTMTTNVAKVVLDPIPNTKPLLQEISINCLAKYLEN